MSLLLHQIRQPRGQKIHGILPDLPCPIGTAMMFGFDPVRKQKKFELAHRRADGFLCEHLVSREAYDSAVERGLETPYYIGGYGSIECASELECEGSDYILTNPTMNGHLSLETKIGTWLSFRNGLFTVAEDGEPCHFQLLQLMNPVITGNLRIYVGASG